jgi:hypothetical protein
MPRNPARLPEQPAEAVAPVQPPLSRLPNAGASPVVARDATKTKLYIA